MSGLIEFWHWWALGLLLVVLEIFLPGYFFLWLAVAAGIVGLIILVGPEPSWEIQLMLYAGFALVSVIIWFRFYKGRTPPGLPTLNRRAEQHVGQLLTLDQAIVDGVGSVKIGDSRWRVEGPELPPGTKVRVSEAKGATLVVEAAEAPPEAKTSGEA